MFTKSNMVSHSRMHSGIRPFACDRCPKSYTQKTNLIAHQNSAHNNKRSFKCLICKRNFFQQGHLSAHIKNHVKRNEVPDSAGSPMPLGAVTPDDGDYPAPHSFYDAYPYHSPYQFPNYNYDAFAGFGATGAFVRPEPYPYATMAPWNLPVHPQEPAYPAYDDLHELYQARFQHDVFLATFEPPENDSNAAIGDFLTTATFLPGQYCNESLPPPPPPEELRPPQRIPFSRLLHKSPSARLQAYTMNMEMHLPSMKLARRDHEH